MKILPILLLNVVMVGGGIAVYHQLREDAPAPVYRDASGLTADDLARLDERYLGRNTAGEPMLRATGVDERVLARLAVLEKNLGPAEAGSASPAAGDGTLAAREQPLASPAAGESAGEPSDDEVARFRRLQERADAIQRAERERERLAGFLQRLEIDLTEEQREKLLGTQRSYREQMGVRMRKVWESGTPREERGELMRTVFDGLRQEFSVEIQEYLSVGDAQKITENLNQLVRGGFGDRGRGGPARVVGGGGGR